jgi:ankyrin repeat protein
MYEYPVFGPFSSSINTAWTDVISAIQDGNLTEAEKSNAFLHQGTYGWTIYHWAVHSNASPDVVAILIEEGSLEAVTKVDEEGVTPLNMACWAVAPFEVIDLFIKAAPEAITTVDKEQFTAIHSAAKRHPSTEVMRALVNAGGRAAVRTLASAQRTTLFLACDEETCILDNIQLLVEVGGTDTVLLADDDGTTPLHELCHRQEPRLDVIRYILETGKQEVVLRSDEEEKLPLHFACQSSSSVELVTLLLESGGSDTIDAPDTGNFTPFMNACKSDGIHSLEIVKLLIDKRGEALNLRNVLHLAIDRAQPQIDLIRLLVDLDATLVYQVDENDSTPLHSACQIGAKEIVLLLVEVGGKQLVLMPDSAGITPLILSLARDVDYSDEDFISIIKCLIDSGGSEGLSKCDDWGNTPLHNACWNTNNSVGIVELIVEKGDKHVVLSQNRRGYTPLLLACMIPQDENVVQYLLDAGGYAAVMQDDDDGRIPLHYLFVHGAPVRMIAEFICIGGEESLLQCDIKGNNPFFYRRVNWMDENFPSARKAKPWDKIFLNEAFITSGLWKCLLGLYIQVLVLIVFSFIIPTFTRPESEGIPYWCSCCLIFILVFQGLASLQQIIGHPLKTILFSIRRVLAFCQFFLICYVAKVSQHQNNLSELGQHLVLVASVVIWLNFVSTLTYLSYDVSVLVRVFWEVGIF